MTISETELPEDLAELERLLSARPQPEPRKALRGNVLASVQEHAAGARRNASAWRFAASVAAVAFLWANLSMVAARGTEFISSPRLDIHSRYGRRSFRTNAEGMPVRLFKQPSALEGAGTSDTRRGWR